MSVPAGSRSTGPTLIRGQVLALDGSGRRASPSERLASRPDAFRPTCATDRNGAWVLVFPDDAGASPAPSVMVTATIDESGGDGHRRSQALGQRTVVPQARLRGRAARQSAAPVAGAAISLLACPATVSSGPDGSGQSPCRSAPASSR